MACLEIGSRFVWCQKEDGYQQRSAILLAEGRRRTAVPTLVATDVLRLFEDLQHLYLETNRPYGVKEYHFKTRLRDQQGLFEG